MPTTLQRDDLKQAIRFACWFAAIKLVFLIAANLWQAHLGYGLHRDELYYLICGRRLAWGYVDQAPLIALQSRLSPMIFGQSLAGVRMLTALAGAAQIFLVGILCWQLGGRRRAQFLAMFGVLIAPQMLAIDSLLTMNSFEPLFWLPFLMLLLALTRGASPKLWLAAGALAGIGLLNKPSMLFFMTATLAALLLTPQRKILYTRYLPLGALLALVIVSPYFAWQYHNDWATYRYLRIERLTDKYAAFSMIDFIESPEGAFLPITLPLWVGGLYWLLHDRLKRNVRWLGLTFLLFFFLMARLQAKDYYLAPIYSLLFAAGGVLWESLLEHRRVARYSTAIVALFSAACLAYSAFVLPVSIPLVSPTQWPHYLQLTGQQIGRPENFATAELPQFFADRFGWREMAAEIRRIVATLPPEDRAHLGILTDNFGEASAINYFNTPAESPIAVSGHNNYFLWGPNGYSGDELLLITDKSPADLAKTYASVQPVGHLTAAYAMPYEHKTIYLVRDRIRPLVEDWPSYQWYY